MISKDNIYKDLEAYCTKEEFDPIRDKVKRYLQIYTGNIEFETFSFTIYRGYVKNIKFYISKSQNIYRRLAFDKYGEVISVHHFKGDICTTGLSDKSISYINGERDDVSDIYKRKR